MVIQIGLDTRYTDVFVAKLSNQSKIFVVNLKCIIMDLFFLFISGYDKGCLIPQEETGGWYSRKGFQFQSSKKFCRYLISCSQFNLARLVEIKYNILVSFD